MIKPNIAQVQIESTRGARRELAAAGNVIFTQRILDFLTQLWSEASPTTTVASTAWPWRVPTGYANPTRYGLGYSGYYSAGGDADNAYDAGAITNLGLATVDGYRMRRSGATSLTSADAPVVIGGVTACMGPGVPAGCDATTIAVAHTNIPTAQVGPLYGHAVRGPYTATAAIGAAYLTGVSSGYPYVTGRVLHGGCIIRITTAANRGTYIVRNYDATAARLYLMNLDGTPFVGAVAGSVSFTVGIRMSYFNETGDSPVGTGTTTISGTYHDPNRDSYIVRIRPEKSGGTTADFSQGSYWFSARPWNSYDGIYGVRGEDAGTFADNRIRFNAGAAGLTTRGIRQDVSAGFVGGIPGMAFDATNQRLWLCSTDNTNGNIMWWRYKCPETFREVASTAALAYSGYAIAGITMTGAVPRALDRGSDNAIYVALYGGANAGWVRIASDLTASQILSSALGTGTNCNGLAVDRSRARAGGTNTVTTVAGTGSLTCSDGAFTTKDLGRVIKITGGADAGTYLISAYTSGTQVTCTTLAGGANPFVTGQVTTGTWEIGDRIYLFWNDATSEGAATLTYMESLAWGTKLQRTGLVKTNGRTLYNGARPGSSPPCSVDPKSGVLFYASSDVAAQVNRFDPSGTTVNNKTIASYTAAGSVRGAGAGTCTNPTLVNAIGCNPSTYFNEVWLATDAGHIQLTNPNTDLTTYERYFGSTNTDYNAPAGHYRPDGSQATAGINLRNMVRYAFGPDGRVFGMALVTSTTSGAPEYVQFNRSNGLWTTGGTFGANGDAHLVATTHANITSDGQGRIIYASTNTANSTNATLAVHGLEIHYQWVGGAWVPKEVVRGTLPDATSSPGCSCKPLHTTTDDLIWGVKVAFTPQGGATPANREFIGVIGQVTAQQADGATTLGANTFDGSGFVAADTGRYLRIESGADQGVYIATYVSATQVTLKKLNGTAWTATATAGVLNYTKWETSEDNYPGPECSSFYLASGFGKDNQQTIDNFSYEVFIGKTTLSVNAEAKKACTGVLGAPGATGVRAYLDTYTRAVNPNYNPALGGHVALPAALTLGEQLLDGIVHKATDGTLGRVNGALPTSIYGRAANANTAGSALTIDLGAAVEVGSVIFRVAQPGAGLGCVLLFASPTTNSAGCIANLWKTTATPVAASVVRTSGVANLSCANGTTLPLPTLSVSSGDLLGSLTTSNTDGSTTQNDNRFDAVSTPFLPAHVGQVLKILGGTDVGSYRIISVDAGGAFCRVRNLDQTATSFGATASALSWQVRDAVREEDMIAVPNVGAPTHKLCIERLLTPTTAEVRISPHSSLTNVSWDAVKPSWDHVKRVSHAVTATPPDVVGNGTYAAAEGLEDSDTTAAAKFVLDLSDLPAASRTGRYWKLALSSRWTTAGTQYDNFWRSAEFYDPAGNRIGGIPSVDSLSDAQFLASLNSRFDFILGDSACASHVAGVNGAVSIAANGYTATLAGGNVWLGRQVRPLGTAGAITGGDGVFTGNASDPQFVDSDTGRILRITTGVNAGYYRISLVTSGTSVTLVRPDGVAVILAADVGPVSYAVHEGPQVNTTTPDFLAITTGGVSATNVELTITGVSADLKTLTIAEAPAAAITAQPWELRRRGVYIGASAPDPAYSARFLSPALAYPQQSGDVVAGTRGTLAFWANDIGGAFVRSTGQTVIGTGTFNGAGFTPDDVDSILVITSGADAGAYRISAYTSATQITVVNAYTGAAVTFSVTSAANLTYVVKGERHYRNARYTTVLRQ